MIKKKIKALSTQQPKLFGAFIDMNEGMVKLILMG